MIKKLTAVFFALLLFVLPACKSSRPKNGDKTIKYHLDADPKTLDPQIASDSPSVIAIHSLFEGLVRIGSDGHVVPGVAEKWSSNEENTEFLFTLRKDAKWSDGTPVTAGDFVFAFRRALAPSTSSPACSQMFCIKNARSISYGKAGSQELGVTAKDDHTLIIYLEYPYADFPTLTASTVYMPCNEKFFNSTAGRYGLEKKYVLGNGPFTIDGKYGWEHGKYLNLKRSKNYAGDTVPLPSNVDFSIGEKDTVMSDPVAALSAGTVDAAPIDSSQIEDARSKGCTLISFEDTTWGLCFHTKSSMMKNVKIRKAFLQAIDRTKVLSHLSKNMTAADDIILPSVTVFGDNYRSLAGNSFYMKQTENAAQLLAKGLSELNLSGIESIRVLCPDRSDVKLMLNEMIVSWNQQFKNYFNMEALDESDLKARVKSGNYEIALYPITPSSDRPISVLSRFSSSSPDNITFLSDPSYDALLESAESKGEKEAVADYATAEKYLNEQGIFYPLYYEKHYYATAKGVTGILFYPFRGVADFIHAGKE